MLAGWKLFKYSREVMCKGDMRSFCDTDLTPYRQTLYTNSRDDELTIYSNGYRHLTVFVKDDCIEVSLETYSTYKTSHIIIERIKTAEYKIDRIEKLLVFRRRVSEGPLRCFKLGFYNDENTREFFNGIKSSKMEFFINQMNQLGGIFERQDVEPIEVKDIEDFISKINALIKRV